MCVRETLNETLNAPQVHERYGRPALERNERLGLRDAVGPVGAFCARD